MNDKQRVLINAFHDGQLDEKQRQTAKRLLEESPQARSYLRELAGLDRLLSSSFDPIQQEPIPARFHVLLTKERPPAFSRYVVPTALAASLLLAAILVVKQETADQQMRDQLSDMRQEIAQLRQHALENTPSGKASFWVAPVGQARAEVMPLQTFRANNRRFCREYEERVEDANGVEIRRGIACRTGNGQWPDLIQRSPKT